MKTWIPERDAYLQELLRREGRGDFIAEECRNCPYSPSGKAVFRCLDCSPGPLRCAACLCAHHAGLPYHRVLRWTGRAFESSSLYDAGHSIQLGHTDGSLCSNPIPARKDFCAIDVNGRHNLRVSFCGCDRAAQAGNLVQQLLRFDLYPATQIEPNTAFTFRLLEHYHIQSLQGKISMFDYYESLERLTDNTGTQKLQNRYKAFMRVVAQWRHLKMLKRGGRGHDPTGVAGTRPGQLAVQCPACPRPHINIPENWHEISEDLQYLYVLSVAIDACFRLKRRAVSDEDKDPILGSGWGYFVEDTGYKEILAQYAEQSEMSTCTGLSAIDHANSKYHKGYAATGVGAVVCARHEFMLANGVGDTQVGERYVNMDYIFVSAMLHHLVVNKLITYDIACQWSKGLVERIAKFPAHMQVELPPEATAFGVPKLHYHSHKREGHAPFSLNYRLGAGRLDGEGIERRWWWIQPIANSTKGMGPGQRQSVLEDQWGYANWRKFVRLAWTLRDRLRVAVLEYREHQELYLMFTDSLDPVNVALWTAQIAAWEKDQTLDDPYLITAAGVCPTQAEIRREIAVEESEASAKKEYVALHDMTPSGFIAAGIEIEEAQHKLRRDATTATASKLPALVERRHALRRRITKYREMQAIYMPSALPVLAEDPAARLDVELIENVRLGLPSDISDSHRSVVCSSRLQNIEARLREAQCRDALQDVRNKLHSLAHLYKYKRVNVRHQGPNTRARADLDKQDERKLRAVERYRRARRAFLALSGPGEWEKTLRVLNDDDVRHMTDDDPHTTLIKRKRSNKGPAEGRRKVSWIWQGADADGNGSTTDSLRVEWLNTRARSMRWGEETKLLPEEMRRSLATLRHEENVWLARAAEAATCTNDPKLLEGMVAYALDQAAIRKAMRATFRAVCLPIARVVACGTTAEWDAVEGVMYADEDLPEEEEEYLDMARMYELDGEDLERPQWA
ncbi:hypothetical protein C8Q76DRAFT_634374 [Earliella scabrosa]|nr:hypothetical protein C8Q76DRAFT_634374 [Earliella scabrosa]